MPEEPLRTDGEIEQALSEYGDLVYKLALARCGGQQADAEDIFQEVFVRLVCRDKPFESETHRRAWLIRVTVNCANKLYRAAWNRKTQPLDERLAWYDREPDDTVLRAVSALPPKDRVAIHLFYYEDMSAKQIAAALGCQEATVTSRLSRARVRLRTILKEESEDAAQTL